MKVFGARCIVREVKNEVLTDSGIFLPGKDKESTNMGIVVQVGDGALLDNGVKVPMDVKVGDKVLYASFAGSPIVKQGDEKDETFLVLNERDILVVLED